MDYLGAGNAAKKIFLMLNEKGLDVDFFVKKKKSKFSKKIKLKFHEQIHDKFFDFFNYGSNKFLNNRFSKKYNPYYKSLGWLSSPYPEIINKSEYNIVQLNWINNFLSINDILKINKPLVWRFSDMWPILGINHYNFDTRNNNLYSKLEKLNLEKKEKFQQRKFNIIAPSKWMKSEIEKKRISKNWSINTIYTPINDKIFFPVKQNITNIKKKYQIDENHKVLCFCADDINEKRKGLHKIIEIFEKKLVNDNNFTLLTIGKGMIDKKVNNLRIVNLGYISSQHEINQIFNISDLLILFSDIDNLPQVGLEAQMSGLPVITFNNTGTSEIIENEKTGLYADDTLESIASKLKLFFLIHKKDINFRTLSRKRSLSLWSTDIIYSKYLSLYESLMNDQKK